MSGGGGGGLVKCGEDPRWWRGIMAVAAGASGQRATEYPYYHRHDNTTLLLLVTRCQAVVAGIMAVAAGACQMW